LIPADLRRLVSMRGEAVAALRGLTIVGLRASSCASPARVRGRLRLRNSGTLRVGRALSVDGFPLPTKVLVQEGAELIIGSGCYLNYGVDIVAAARITIGDGVLVGPLVSIVDDDMHQVEPGRDRRRLPIHIDANVWIGRGVTVLPGTVIGAHSVVAAGSVVRGEVPPRTIVAGVPARPVREIDVPEDGWRRR
jgi:acetyltransferase-like isoleucine patch superfamily enzyme